MQTGQVMTKTWPRGSLHTFFTSIVHPESSKGRWYVKKTLYTNLGQTDPTHHTQHSNIQSFHQNTSNITSEMGPAWWHMSVISATQEAEIGGFYFPFCQPGQKLTRWYLKSKLGVVAIPVIPAYEGGGGRRIPVPGWSCKSMRPYLKNKLKEKGLGTCSSGKALA
jgi:hypothetical protein